ncbi:unnamed product [Ostreococcus tauri]|uniref:Unnamed product n=1 Tax=Ostreococcus tauri TaxID=70448 RepID=Q00W47_OSTTA|nr:unnamed product [Ostreococcus tauri]CAL56911.1 unnamed product [Ostreococcus tauri]|eukprot:XP_003082956.1 unnamed product [Ostreococcus tauri]
MTSRALAAREIDAALDAIDDARANVSRLVDALSTAAKQSESSTGHDLDRLIRACARDAASIDALATSATHEVNAVLTTTRETTDRKDALGDRIRAGARGGTLETRVDEANGETIVTAIAPRAFVIEWALSAPEDPGRMKSRSTDGLTTHAHNALGDRLREVASEARGGEKGSAKDEDVAVKMLEWLETMHDVFTRPDELSGGCVLAADRTRGGVLIPGRLLPGRPK